MRYFKLVNFIAVLMLMSVTMANAKPPVMTLAMLEDPAAELKGWKVVGEYTALDWCRHLQQNGRYFSKLYPLTSRPVILSLVNAEFLKGVPVGYARDGTWRVYKYGIIAENRILEFYLVKRVMPQCEIPDAKRLNEVHARAKYRHGMAILNDPRSGHVEWTEAYCHLGSAADAGHIKAAYQTALLLRDRLRIEPENVLKYMRMAAQNGYLEARREYQRMYGEDRVAVPESPLEGETLRAVLMADLFRVAPGLTVREAQLRVENMMHGVQPMEVEENEQDPVVMDVEVLEPDPVATIVRAVVPRGVHFNLQQRGCN